MHEHVISISQTLAHQFHKKKSLKPQKYSKNPKPRSKNAWMHVKEGI